MPARKKCVLAVHIPRIVVVIRKSMGSAVGCLIHVDVSDCSRPQPIASQVQNPEVQCSRFFGVEGRQRQLTIVSDTERDSGLGCFLEGVRHW